MNSIFKSNPHSPDRITIIADFWKRLNSCTTTSWFLFKTHPEHTSVFFYVYLIKNDKPNPEGVGTRSTFPRAAALSNSRRQVGAVPPVILDRLEHPKRHLALSELPGSFLPRAFCMRVGGGQYIPRGCKLLRVINMCVFRVAAAPRENRDELLISISLTVPDTNCPDSISSHTSSPRGLWSCWLSTTSYWICVTPGLLQWNVIMKY